MGTPMTLPTIHPNGTPKRMLVEQLCHASSAIAKALVAVSESCPNGRDHYPTGTLPAALAEHSGRLDRLEAVKREVDALALAIDAL